VFGWLRHHYEMVHNFLSGKKNFFDSVVDSTTHNDKITVELISTKKHLPFSEEEEFNGFIAHTAHVDELAVISSEE
jgi:hypothetical protein